MKFTKEHKQKLSEARLNYFKNGGVNNKGMLGKKHTDEWKEFMRQVMTGRDVTNETRAKMSKSAIGNKNGMYEKTPEHIKKVADAQRGKFVSIESRKKMSEAQKGEKSRMWKGGVSPLGKSIRHCFKYRLWRSDVFERDEFTCQDCGNNDFLEPHHIKTLADIVNEYELKTLSDAEDCEELWNINNGKTLCKECHKKYRSK